MRTAEELVALALVCAGVAFIFWPAALIVGGALIALHANTPKPDAKADD